MGIYPSGYFLELNSSSVTRNTSFHPSRLQKCSISLQLGIDQMFNLLCILLCQYVHNIGEMVTTVGRVKIYTKVILIFNGIFNQFIYNKPYSLIFIITILYDVKSIKGSSYSPIPFLVKNNIKSKWSNYRSKVPVPNAAHLSRLRLTKRGPSLTTSSLNWPQCLRTSVALS